MHWRASRDVVAVFLLALLARLFGVVVTTLSSANPYAQADADGFAASAGEIAATLTAGSLPVLTFRDVYDVWGAMLSPFWLLPGPSRIYARIGMAVLGALCVYNVFVVVRHYHSRRAGFFATLPMIAYPSFVFVHASVLREVVVLFGLTTAARLLLAPSDRLGPGLQFGGAAAAVGLSWMLRTENLAVYLLVVGVGTLVSVRVWKRAPRTTRVAAVVGAIVGPAVILVKSSEILDRLADLRQRRARDRTQYLEWVYPDTIPEAVAFSWIGAAYFLFTPFPWMVGTVADLVVAAEAVVNLIYTLFAVHGTRVLATRTLPGAGALAVGIVVGSVLYGLGTANVGTAVRHRQMVLWAIFLLGGIGVANLISVRRGQS